MTSTIETSDAAERPRVPEGSWIRPVATYSPNIFLPHLVAGLGGVSAVMIDDPRWALRWLSLVSCLYALHQVVVRGRVFLTPSGVFFLSTGAFIGLASFYLADVGGVSPTTSTTEIRDWAVVAFLVTVGIGIVLTALTIRWRLRWPSREELRLTEPDQVPRSPLNFQFRALVMVGLSQLPQFQALGGAAATAVGLGGVMMLVLAASARRVQMRWHGDLVLVALAVIVPIVWIRLEFEGGGRLTLAGLGIASLLAWNLVRPRRLQKVMVVLAIPVFLVYAGLNRLDKDSRDSSTESVLTTGQGLESMYSPLDSWTELVTLDPEVTRQTQGEEVGPRFGRTFLITATLPIPRSLWENKPKGWGAELTEILRPTYLREELIAPDHSMAALIHGEFYANFGIWGLGMIPFALGWFLALLDRAHARLAGTGLATPDDWWRAAILVALVSSLGDLFWVGTFTFFARGGLAAIVVWMVWRFSTHRQGRVSHAYVE